MADPAMEPTAADIDVHLDEIVGAEGFTVPEGVPDEIAALLRQLRII